jgi:hypothetical protein
MYDDIKIVRVKKTGLAIVIDGCTTINEGRRDVDRRFANNVERYLKRQSVDLVTDGEITSVVPKGRTHAA